MTLVSAIQPRTTGSNPRFRPLVATVVLIVAIAALAAAGCGDSAACPVCKRQECRNMAFTIELPEGRTVETCCPRCGLRYVETESLRPTGFSVRSFETATPLIAADAFYVVGSDVSPCSGHGLDPPRDERGCCLTPIYDRCLPSILAFGTRDGAMAFAREHGGFVRSFGELTPQDRRAPRAPSATG